MEDVCAVILKVSYPAMGNTADIEILGKTMLEWAELSLSGMEIRHADYTESVTLPVLLKPYLNTKKDITVVLYSDTPLISKKTVASAVQTLKDKGLNVLKMTRGYVIKTAFLLGAEKLYTDSSYYFEEDDFITAFNFKQVQLITEVLKNRILNYHMENGVYFEDGASAFVGSDVTIGRGVRIAPNNILLGKTVIKDGVRIKAGNVIEDCIIGEGAVLDSSRMYGSFIGAETTVGPFAYIRPESVIGENCRIGDFVEIKKSVIGDGSKISHLSYIGDCEMGKECNIGCGVITANYDGKDKHKTVIGDRVFVGSNSNLIAPVEIKEGAFIAAGSTVTDSVPPASLVIARARQVTKPAWGKNKYKRQENQEL